MGDALGLRKGGGTSLRRGTRIIVLSLCLAGRFRCLTKLYLVCRMGRMGRMVA